MTGRIESALLNKVAMSVQVFPSVLREVDDDAAGAVANGNVTRGRDLRTVEPIDRGLVRDWEALESMWRYIFYTNLGWEMGNEGQVLLAEPLGTSKVMRGGDEEGILCWKSCRIKTIPFHHMLSGVFLLSIFMANEAVMKHSVIEVKPDSQIGRAGLRR